MPFITPSLPGHHFSRDIPPPLGAEWTNGALVSMRVYWGPEQIIGKCTVVLKMFLTPLIIIFFPENHHPENRADGDVHFLWASSWGLRRWQCVLLCKKLVRPSASAVKHRGSGRTAATTVWVWLPYGSVPTDAGAAVNVCVHAAAIAQRTA